MILPSAIEAYFDSDRASDTAAITDAFDASAVVVDEGRTYRGRDAIAAWRRKAKTDYAYVVEPFASDAQGDVTTVRATVTGAFPGSPLTLAYRFRLTAGRIASLEIGS